MRRTRCCSRLGRPRSTSSVPRSRERSDVFHGDPRLRRFSTRLMQDSRGVSDEEIAGMLGPGTVEAFRFAEHVLRGRRRRTTDEPAFCHSADIALRAADLGYGERVLKCALLHDVVEDGAAHLVEMDLFLQQMHERFGSEVGRDVRILTNRYAKILDERPIRERLSSPPPFDESGRQALAEAVREGAFREDLYYRLEVLPLRIPPLRERPLDIEALADHFLDRQRRRTRRPDLQFSPEARDLLVRYDWPGNVRELRNAIERACVLAEGPRILPEDLGLPVRLPESGEGLLALQERETVIRVLREVGGNRKAAAARLGISLRTLQYRLKEYGLLER